VISKNCPLLDLLSIFRCQQDRTGGKDKLVYLVAGPATLAVLEQGLVAAGRHGRERRQVHVLESTGTTCTSMSSQEHGMRLDD
jgi:hypothetical protein